MRPAGLYGTGGSVGVFSPNGAITVRARDEHGNEVAVTLTVWEAIDLANDLRAVTADDCAPGQGSADDH